MRCADAAVGRGERRHRARRVGRPANFLVMLLAVLAAGGGCWAFEPRPLSGGPVVVHRPFSHDELAPILDRFVDDLGQVDYTALKAAPRGLERYYYLLARYSPDHDPEVFPSRADALAYWINAYNAAVLKAVIGHYPIASIEDVRPPWFVAYLPRKSGFFVFQRFILGARTTSLYFLENRVIRRRFRDARVHFVLNCASRGCPRLRRQPLVAANIDEQLDSATREFVADARYVRVDHDARRLDVSSLFDWYADDFREWGAARRPGAEPTIVEFLAAYVPHERVAEFERAATYSIHYLPWDWALNDQATAGGGAPVEK